MRNKRNLLFLPQSDQNCRMPTLYETTLLEKLYYSNIKNAEAAVREFLCLKKRRGLMLTYVLKHMMVKFEKTGQLGVLPRRGRKRDKTAVVENIAIAVVEASTESFHEIFSVPKISCTLDILYSTTRHIFA
ncbi:DUF4817 domain-containing protein [Trichonephila clavipes]|nr:DUF4817 domain-containing protein [Trichonephila clavipes]